MEFLTLENVSKSYGEKILFDKLNLNISKGQKIALVAQNGTGKSTLMRVIFGQEAPEGENCKVQFRKGIRIGFLEQDPEFRLDHTIMEAVFESENPLIQAIKRYETALQNPNDENAMQEALTLMDDLKAWDFEANIKEILSKLNINDLAQTVATLSGGQKKRLALAKLIIEEPEFVILDEPTNHLDMDMIEWLENYLSQPNLTIFMVTHDRYFLERICDNIVELDGGNLYKYKGNYADFLEKKTEREENQNIVLAKNKKLLKKELEWVRRMPSGRGTKAKARVNAFHQLKEETYGRRRKDQMQIDIKGQRMGSKILEAEYISKSYGDKKMVEDFHYKFKKGERVGIVGPNGVGKSTFLKLITKEIRPDSGNVVVGGTIVFGHYTQDGIQLPEDKRVIEVVRDIAEYIPLEKGMKLSAIQLLERFLFNGPQQQIYVSQLSGGEKRRLYLLTVLMQNPNFLILDEPTNDLDILTLNVMEDFLMDFPGCIVIVSHDRYFMDKLVDHIFVFEGDGKIKDYNGNYTEYRQNKKIQQREERKQIKATTPTKEKEIAANPDAPRKLNYMERKEFNKLEKEIDKLEAQKATIIEKFNDTTLEAAEIEKLSIELGELNNTIEEKEMRWLELSEFA